ncbi:PREDICTED: thyroid transcription factor 1-associated protein 26 [Haliaeetus leucocephalus]|uniref:thyroid transcription factor 1-associated protein 26 n=1 Tax=Haliaeetus leucocephalus TaxID=52644 RepID=UPI00053CCB70|nr:PREDICTED: thyroid transcription factor 1-associated protein 26 [Haliaeetus leucocephalus]
MAPREARPGPAPGLPSGSELRAVGVSIFGNGFGLLAGRGFAFRRKQKIERQYRKLLKRGRKVHSQQDNQFTDTYPEHLKHLYLAEEEMLKKRCRAPDDSVLSEEKLNKAVESVMTEGKFKKKTSNQKAKEEYEKIKAERARKKEEAEKRKQQREAAQRLYKQKKMEAYKILSKKTKKGQPNLNLQMEFLLQKIQQNT